MKIIASSKKKNNRLTEVEILAKLRSFLANSSLAKEICREKNLSETFLQGVPISFDDMKESAKTVNSNIYLNRKLADKPLDMIKRYLIHELTHAVQHVVEPGVSAKMKKKEYLDKDTEVEAFQNQIEFQKSREGKEATEKYVENLLDFHDIKGKKREDKKDELLS